MKLLGLMVVIALLAAGCSGDSAPEPTPTSVAAVPTTASAVTTSSVGTVTTAPAAPTSTTTTTAVIAEEVLAGWDRWTLIFASLDTEEHSRGDAEVLASGIEDGAVLLSDDYPSLNPGYWVVYAGEWGERRQASIWCQPDLDPAFTCYPRYLGPSIPTLLNDGAAIAQLEGRLVALEIETGDVLATFSDNFYWEAVFPAQFNLNADSRYLFFSLGWEDGWYSCESDAGEVRRLDLDSGIEDVLGDGWSPAVSPDGRWLAIVAAGECYPDPEVAGWVVSPGNRVEIYDLTDGDFVPDRVLTSGTPETYDDARGVRRVAWDPATDGDLLVWLADGSVRRIAPDFRSGLTGADLVFASEVGELAAVSATDWYLIESSDVSTVVSVVPAAGGDQTDSFEIDGWVTGFALGRSGGVIITTWEYLVLPSGERVQIDGGINNLAW